jgi:hypothetical protein
MLSSYELEDSKFLIVGLRIIAPLADGAKT